MAKGKRKLTINRLLTQADIQGVFDDLNAQLPALDKLVVVMSYHSEDGVRVEGAGLINADEAIGMLTRGIRLLTEDEDD